MTPENDSQLKMLGFIGLGVMGSAMVQRLVDAGYNISLYCRDPRKALSLENQGAQLRGSPAQLAKACSKIFTIVGGPSDVRELYLGPEGLIANAEPGTILVDMTTSAPTLAQEIHVAARSNDIDTLDAPVTGGAPGAEKGQLSFMVGGDEAILDKVRAELEHLGSLIFLMGPAGAGQTTKMCNQLSVGGILLGMAEALDSAIESGLDPEKVLEVLLTGTASSTLLPRIGPKMINGDQAASFLATHFIKDLSIANDSAKNTGRSLPAAELCGKLFQRLVDNGGQKKGIQSLIEVYQKQLHN